VPGSWVFVSGDTAVAQMMLADCIGHSGRIWNHVVGWAKTHINGAPVLARSREMMERYSRWKEFDTLTALPAPPPFPPNRVVWPNLNVRSHLVSRKPL
jgi:hypothetical protein